MSQGGASSTCMFGLTELGDTLKIVSKPRCLHGDEAKYGAHHLLHNGDQYWVSEWGDTTNIRFIFESEQAHSLVRFEWKSRGNDWDPAKMSLEAQVGEAWKEVSTWDTEQGPQTIDDDVMTKKWRLTFMRTFGHPDSPHMNLCAVRFVVRLTPVPALIHTKLLADRNFTDVEILVGERRFPAHRAVLAAASPVFSAMLLSDMREARSGEIRLQTADEESMEATLHYIYTGLLHEDAPGGVVVLAHTYEIEGLLVIAARLALEKLTVENAAATVQMLQAYDSDATLGAYWQQLLDILQANRELLEAALRKP